MPEVSEAAPDGLTFALVRTRGLWPRLRPWLIAALVLLLGLLVFRGLGRVLVEVSYDDILAAAAEVSVAHLAMAVLATVASYAALTGYDFSGLHYAGARLPWRTVCLTSFIAFALGNSVGLGALTGGGVRMRLFTAAGVEPARIAKAAAFNAAAFGVGMLVFGALGILWDAERVASLLRMPAGVVQALALAGLAAVAVFVAVCARRREIALWGRWRLPLPSAGLAVRQLVISALELAAAAASLWFLLPQGVVPLPEFMAFYAIGIALGVISHVPGGLGVFEAVILLAFAGRAPAGEIAAALALYRCVYFLLPLALATVLLAVLEARASTYAAPVARAARRLAPRLVAACTLVAGVSLLVSGVTPASETAVETLAAHLPLYLVEASHLIGSIAGFVLLLLSRGLLHRLAAAWWGTLLVLGAAAVVALPKGMTVPELALLCGLLALLLLTRRQFDRPSSLYTGTLEPDWLIAVSAVLLACIWLFFFVYRDLDYSDRLWWQFAFDAHAPRALRALMLASIVMMGIGLWQLLRRPDVSLQPPTQQEMAAAQEIVRRQSTAQAGLALMGDKSLLFSASGEAFIMFAKQGRSWVALSDPVGRRADWSELVWRFIEMADAHGGRAVFYKTRPQTLPLYLDAGLRAFKLGEQAQVSLPDFSLNGPERAKLRQALGRGKRDGLVLDVIEPQDVAGVLDELRVVSDAWLGMHKAQEKGFSLGTFDPAYLQRQPVAVVRLHAPGEPGKVVAFASLLRPDVERIEVGIDLMRHLPEVPAATMDFLFTSLILHFQALGYQRLDLGMAPMSGMSEHELASVWHRTARLMFMHGGRFYNFRGLRAFKDKFGPQWEARYLVCARGLAPLFAMADTTALINGGLKGVVGK
ncbi:bifunctional lysylphosphatidylglycerol flippase/synthetase MprF [Verticiella sediminum]|uniref:bifunctional lysylphosphatidylglycerol flippase/synthetase MprF n=1 Tax=Verticiella sediminum TaxID=1247510 RepID=UPI001B88058F|nr:bifunctional lysylphosphatidylglycerol flippase/synthetase MprF [Verticiella sediminum]